MAVIVTGAAGFLGRHLVTALLEDGHEVAGFDNFVTSDRDDLAELLHRQQFVFREMDVAGHDFRRVAGEIDATAIYHLACPTGVPNLGPLALEMLEASYSGTRAVLDVARADGATVVFASSAEVYGDPTVSPQHEGYTGNVDTLGPRKGYEEGKRVGETLCAVYAERYGVPAKIARIFNTYGPGMSLRETRVVPAFVRAALSGASLLVQGDGSQLRCHTYATDMVDGLRRVAQRGTPGAAYNLGSQDAKTVLATAQAVIALTGSRSPIERVERPAHDHEARLPDTTRAERELGWRPTTPFEVGLRLTVDDIARRLEARRDAATRVGSPT